MSRTRITTWVLALVVAMTARTTVAAPRASTAELRALACCLRHCPDAPRPAKAPHRCCVVDAAANDPAGTAGVPSVERPAAAPVALLAASAPVVPSLGVRNALVAPPLRAGPLGGTDTLRLRC